MNMDLNMNNSNRRNYYFMTFDINSNNIVRSRTQIIELMLRSRGPKVRRSQGPQVQGPNPDRGTFRPRDRGLVPWYLGTLDPLLLLVLLILHTSSNMSYEYGS